MGIFYTNVALLDCEQRCVVDAVVRLGREAYVSPTYGGITVVYDKECEAQEQEVLDDLARELSEVLDCGALAALNHDDDLLILSLFNSGRFIARLIWGEGGGLEIDGHGTTISEFAGALAGAVGRAELSENLEHVLSLPGEEDRDRFGLPLQAAMIHYGVGLLLGNPVYLANQGYNIIQSKDSRSQELFAYVSTDNGTQR